MTLAHESATAMHARAVVTHTRAAELYEGHADAARERGDAAAANRAEVRARGEHEKASRAALHTFARDLRDA